MEIPLIEIKKADIDIDGRKILSDITWALHPGENWFIDGPNGAGKTTLLRLEEFDATVSLTRRAKVRSAWTGTWPMFRRRCSSIISGANGM